MGRLIASPSDPYFNNVELLLHMNGVNGSTIFIDSSKNNFAVTVNGNAQISTSQSKFGGTSGYFNGTNSFLTNSNISLSTQDFALECWVYPISTAGATSIFNQGNSDITGNFCLFVYDGLVAFYADNEQRLTSSQTIQSNQWTHIALTRQNNIYYLFINGVLDGTLNVALDHYGSPFKIGQGYGGITYFNGYIDEARVTKGIARYTSNFIPQNKEFYDRKNIKNISIKKQNQSILNPVESTEKNIYVFKSATTNLLGTIFNPAIFEDFDLIVMFAPNTTNIYTDPSIKTIIKITPAEWVDGGTEESMNNYIIPIGTVFYFSCPFFPNLNIPVGGEAIIQKFYSGKISLYKKFAPNALQGLALWLKADAGVTLSGSNVTAWTDQSGNGKNATAIEPPTYQTNSINGKPALVFANNAYLTTANIFNGSNARTIIAAYYIDSGQYSNVVIGQSNEDNTDTGTYFLLQSRIDLNSSPYLAGYGDDVSGPAYVNQRLLLGMADYDGTTARLFKNGTQANSEAKSYNTHNGNFYIGAFNEAGNIMERFGGKIAEIIVYNRILTTTERQQVEAYLNEKYAIY
jgi:hypothetical protein